MDACILVGWMGRERLPNPELFQWDCHLVEVCSAFLWANNWNWKSYLSFHLSWSNLWLFSESIECYSSTVSETKRKKKYSIFWVNWDCIQDLLPAAFCFHIYSSIYQAMIISPGVLWLKIIHVWHKMSDSWRAAAKTKHWLWARRYHLCWMAFFQKKLSLHMTKKCTNDALVLNFLYFLGGRSIAKTVVTKSSTCGILSFWSWWITYCVVQELVLFPLEKWISGSRCQWNSSEITRCRFKFRLLWSSVSGQWTLTLVYVIYAIY